MIVPHEILLIFASVGWPLLLTAVSLNEKHLAFTHKLHITAAIPALLTSLLLVSDYEFSMSWLILGTTLGIDETSRIFLLFSSILWIAGNTLLPMNKSGSIAGWYLVTMSASFLVIFAQDIPTFYMAYAAMSLALFGLIINGSEQSRRAAKIYIVFTMIGEMLLFAALIMIAHNTNTLDIDNITDRVPQDILIILLLAGFGIKAGLPLVHITLPPVYQALSLAAAIPVAGSLLHLGLYGWLRFLPLGQVTLPYWSFIILGFGLFAMFYGALVGLTQNKAKSLLAYSSISQMGMMLLLLGIGFSAPSKWHVIQTSLLLFALHHALSKGALFYGLSTQGIHKLALVLPALSLAGLPFTSGALAKSALKDQLIFLPELWVSLINWLLPLASIGTTLLMARFLYLCRNSHHSQTPKGLYWWLLLMCSLLIPWYWSLQTINIISIWSGFWPVLAGAVIAYVVYKGSYQSLFSRTPSIPPGDILILGEKVLKQSHLSSKTEHNTHQEESDFILGPQKAPAFIAVPERYLAKWTNAISLFLMVLIGLFLFLTDIL